MGANNTQKHDSILSELIKNNDSKMQPVSPLEYANQVQQKCAQVGFDWPSVPPVFDKIIEELDEVKEAIANPQKEKADVEEELGDLLFACVNLCRHLQVSPNEAITLASHKFVTRFQQIEVVLQSQGKNTADQSIEELEALWQLVKRST